jgi:hypothetical protein
VDGLGSKIQSSSWLVKQEEWIRKKLP